MRRRPRPVGLRRQMQRAAMRSRYPALTASRERGAAVFSGALEPWGGGAAYDVAVRVFDWADPEVRVVRPAIRPGAPHVYDDDGLLCLYHPRRRPWRLDDLAALTVVPWAQLWLYFYEAWLETGVWWGPEAPHG